MESTVRKTILVTGASGHLGRRVVELLLEARVGHVIAGTRTPEKVSDLLAKGAEVRRVDFDDSSSLEAAFKEVDRILMVSTNVFTGPGRRLGQHQAAIQAAANAAIEHLAYTSLVRSEADAPIAMCADHYGTEQALRTSGLAYTALRHNIYAEAILSRVPAMLEKGEVTGLAGKGGGVAYVTREDCARVAAAVVASAKPPIGPVEITGPEAINEEQLTRLIGEITGKSIRFIGKQADELLNDLVASGIAKARAESRMSFDIAAANGYMGLTTDAVAQLTGRPAMHVRDFLVSAGIAKMTT